jgi:serine/threonine-protein kinase
VNADRWTEIRTVFAAALDHGAGQQAAFLDRRCAGDDALRRDVEALLEADAAAPGGTFLRDAVREAARRLAGMRESDPDRRFPP